MEYDSNANTYFRMLPLPITKKYNHPQENRKPWYGDVLEILMYKIKHKSFLFWASGAV